MKQRYVYNNNGYRHFYTDLHKAGGIGHVFRLSHLVAGRWTYRFWI